jgi:hypothetical protein
VSPVDIVRRIVATTPVQDWQVPATVGIAGPIGHGKSTVAEMLHEKFGHTVIAFADHLRHVCTVALGIPREAMTDRTLKATPLVGFANGYAFPFDKLHPAAAVNRIDLMLATAYDVDIEVFTNAATVANNKEMTTVGANYLSPAAVRRGAQVLFMRHIWIPLRNGKEFSPREIMQIVGTEIFRAIDPPIWLWMWGRHADGVGMAVAPDLRFPNECAMLKERHGMLIRVTRPDQRVDTRHVSETLLDKYDFNVTITNDGTLEDLWHALAEVIHIYADMHKTDVDNGYAKLITA